VTVEESILQGFLSEKGRLVTPALQFDGISKEPLCAKGSRRMKRDTNVYQTDLYPLSFYATKNVKAQSR
jgi:hypothetical protein